MPTILAWASPRSGGTGISQPSQGRAPRVVETIFKYFTEYRPVTSIRRLTTIVNDPLFPLHSHYMAAFYSGLLYQ